MKQQQVDVKKIPYGVSDFGKIVTGNYYYVDKTRFIPELENAGRFLFLIRPRRFGKSSLLTVLESYYDVAMADEFDHLFGDAYIKDHPTPEKNAYLILKLNFSQVNPNLDKVERSFNDYMESQFRFFGKKYKQFLEDDFFDLLDAKEGAHSKLQLLLGYVGSLGHKVYVLLDEYDNFANTILTTAGETGYHKITHGAGFFRFFFNVLKGATDEVSSGISRMFITGVSPLTMDDVTSGFNIGTNISLDPEFNELLGFSRQDVTRLFEYYKNEGLPTPDSNDPATEEWHGNYCFSKYSSEKLYNPDMIFYFLKRFLKSGRPPDHLIDRNIRIDYGKLRHLITLDRKLNGNFSRLEQIIEDEGIRSDVVDSFPVEELTDPENFISLLYYFGLLTFGGKNRLDIPNRTVKKLMYSYLRDGFRDVGMFKVDLWRFADLTWNMAYRGEWQPVFNFLADEVQKQTAIRDYLSGEKVIQTFLLAYLNVTDYFQTRTEVEFGKGFADLYLEPIPADPKPSGYGKKND